MRTGVRLAVAADAVVLRKRPQQIIIWNRRCSQRRTRRGDDTVKRVRNILQQSLSQREITRVYLRKGNSRITIDEKVPAIVKIANLNYCLLGKRTLNVQV